MRKQLWALLLVGWLLVPDAGGDDKVRVVIIDGHNNHNWRATNLFAGCGIERNEFGSGGLSWNALGHRR